MELTLPDPSHARFRQPGASFVSSDAGGVLHMAA